MARGFGSVATDKINVTSSAAIDNLDPWSAVAWVNCATGNDRSFATKGVTASNNRHINWLAGTLSGGLYGMRVVMDRATSDLDYSTTDRSWFQNQWCLVCATFSSANSAGDLVRFYAAPASTRTIRQMTATTATDGSGAFQSDAAVDLPIGNTGNSSNAFLGAMNRFWLYNRQLGIPDLRAIFDGNVPTAGLVVDQDYSLGNVVSRAYGTHGTPTGTLVGELSTRSVQTRYNHRINHPFRPQRRYQFLSLLGSGA